MPSPLSSSALVLASVIALAACSGVEGTTLEANHESPTSSGVVTRQDYLSATSRIIECVASQGAVVQTEERYGLIVFWSDGRDVGEQLSACESGRDGAVRASYEAHYQDPDSLGDAVFLRCFERNGVGTALEAGSDLTDVLEHVMRDPASPESVAADRCMCQRRLKTEQVSTGEK